MAASFIHHFKSWHQVFYIFGALTIVWCFLFVRFHLSFCVFGGFVFCFFLFFFFVFFFFSSALFYFSDCGGLSQCAFKANKQIKKQTNFFDHWSIEKREKNNGVFGCTEEQKKSKRQGAYWWFGSGNGIQ